MFRRLYLPLLLIVVALAAAVGWWSAEEMRTAQHADMKDALRHEARLIHALIQQDSGGDRFENATRKIRGLGSSAGRRVTLIAPDGRVLGDSEAEAATMEPHHLRPEVAGALASGEGMAVRRSDTVGRDFMYF